MGFKIRDNETMINYLKSIKTSIDISRQLSSENGRSKEYLYFEGEYNIVDAIIHDFETGSIVIVK